MSQVLTCEHIEPMLSGFLDNELSQSESQRVALHVKQCEKCAALLAEMKTMQNDLQAIAKQDQGHTQAEIDALDQLLNDTPSRWLGTIAWSLVVMGGLIVSGFFVYELGLTLWQDTTQPLWLRGAIAALYVGFAGLFIMVLRQRLKSLKTDKYRKVKL
ncbi:MAG: putative zinc-finger [Idiomarinaceae bacterium HL-53]|nr:MAG: putative zinc-finger [Idiomarinaceae bacterium HL-53]CUS48094.1 Putative zinc-finger [Idiomarinaceae bacterium HL-53]